MKELVGNAIATRFEGGFWQEKYWMDTFTANITIIRNEEIYDEKFSVWEGTNPQPIEFIQHFSCRYNSESFDPQLSPKAAIGSKIPET